MNLARLNDVVKRFGAVLALDHVDLEVESGEILGLLGPNGAGKTTAIRILAGLLEPDSGAIEVFGNRRRSDLDGAKRRLGLVTQEISVFDDLSARENLEFFGGLYGLRGADLKRRIADTLDFVGLSAHADRRPKGFSGGMRRRLNIACALTHAPEFLIMDEPTVGIDPQSRNHILESVRSLRDRGTTILYTSHYMEEVEALSDRVVILDQGRVIAEGTVNDLIERIHYEERVRIEVGSPSEGFVAALRAIPGVKSVEKAGPAFVVASEAGSDNLDKVLLAARSEGGVRSVETERPSLEDVFLTLTGKSLRDGEAS